MIKQYLLSPGPTPIPNEVALAMAETMIHHRTPQFNKVFDEAREGLKKLFGTKNDVLMLAVVRHRRHGSVGRQSIFPGRQSSGHQRRQVRRALVEYCQRLRLESHRDESRVGPGGQSRRGRKATQSPSRHSGRDDPSQRNVDHRAPSGQRDRQADPKRPALFSRRRHRRRRRAAAARRMGHRRTRHRLAKGAHAAARLGFHRAERPRLGENQERPNCRAFIST